LVASLAPMFEVLIFHAIDDAIHRLGLSQYI
jgi:hypothetical protein